MTREEAIKVLLQHSEHWKRLLTENICSKEEGSQTVEALNMAIKALEQEPCDDAISRQAVLNEFYDMENLYERIKQLPSVRPQEPKTGKWEDLHRCWVCSKCGQETHIEHNYCPNCGADMRVKAVEE